MGSSEPSELPTVPTLLRRWAGLDGDRLAVITDERSISYAELALISAGIAGTLIRDGVSKGARVGLLLQNGVEWVCAAVAVMRIGAVLVPLSTFLRAGELEHQLRVAAVSHLVVTDDFGGRDRLAEIGLAGRADSALWEPGFPSLRKVWASSTILEDAKSAADGPTSAMVAALEAAVSPADDLVIMFTSGSSGAPKGCIHTHGSTIRGVTLSLADRGVRRDDRLYLPMPLFWTGGFGMGLMTALITGCALMTEATSDPARTLRFITRHRTTLFRGWPDQAARIAGHPDFADTDLSALRPGSLDALMPPHLKAKASNARAGLLGMTETFGPYCSYPLDRDMPEDKWGSAGRVQAGVEVRIVDPENGASLLPGQVGAIKVRGHNLMRGVCGRERHETFDADGFYNTGDLGSVDADRFLFYRGRSDDMFKAKGATVYPSEVERALKDIPGVAGAFVTDVGTGQAVDREVGAVVVPAPGARLDPDQLNSALRDRLSAFKRPTRWLIVSSMEQVPMLSSGKVDKRAVREALIRAGR